MQIRTLTLADFDEADALWRRTAGVGPVPREEIARLLEAAPDPVLVAEEDGRIVGAIIGTDDGRRGWIFRLAVDESKRGAGIGRALVDEVERRLAARGINHVRLLVLTDNEVGLGFWAHAGYDRFDDIVMFGKDISGGAPGSDGGASTAPTDRC